MTALPLESSRPPTRPKQWHWACADGLTYQCHQLANNMQLKIQYLSIEPAVASSFTTSFGGLNLNLTHNSYYRGKSIDDRVLNVIKVYLYELFPIKKCWTTKLLSTFFNRALNYMKCTCLRHTNKFWKQVLTNKKYRVFSVSNSLFTYILLVRQPLNRDEM